MSRLIETRSAWDTPEGVEPIHHSEKDRIRDLLMGKSVSKIAEDHLELSDGTVVKVLPNEGGCICSAGDYYLKALNESPNVITNVEFDYEPHGDHDRIYEDGWYRVFVVAFEERINLFNIEGNDGNGYYGTGYSLLVRLPDGE